MEITPQWDGTTWHWVILDEVTLHPNQWIEQSFDIVVNLPTGVSSGTLAFYWHLYKDGNPYTTHYDTVYVWR
ncbi:MAG: hypothetical protein ACTSRC_02690 [Candidatus Helarchaeota archaeon]